MLRAAHVPSDKNAIMETKAEHTQAKIRKAARKARTRQRGRPVSVTHIAPPVPITEQMLQEIQNLHSADPNPFVHSNSTVASRILLHQIALTLTRRVLNTCHVSESQDNSACAPITGTPHKLHARRHPSGLPHGHRCHPSQCSSTCALGKSHSSQNREEDTDLSSWCLFLR